MIDRNGDDKIPEHDPGASREPYTGIGGIGVLAGIAGFSGLLMGNYGMAAIGGVILLLCLSVEFLD